MPIHPRRLAVAGLAGAASLPVYVVAKPRFHGPAAWRVPVVPPGASTTAYHLLETVPVVLVLVGLVGFARTRSVLQGPGEFAGFAVTVAGLAGTVLAHVGEHLLPAVPTPGPLAGNAFVYLYFGSWFLAAAGLGVYGLALLAAGDAPVTGTVVAATLPLGVAVGLAVVALGVDNFGDGMKLPFALVAAATAYRTWTASARDPDAPGVGWRTERRRRS